jgi:hypothetical protein
MYLQNYTRYLPRSTPFVARKRYFCTVGRQLTSADTGGITFVPCHDVDSYPNPLGGMIAVLEVKRTV